ncbi:phosphotransferase enzyme family protein [Nonomuraea sp. CA-141351]|uniref:phosphotransferase enzyme family protein n=1 Tax=Nonomuraea sp. CA-141351 TaxID=3239996 RepID=UPI003D8AA316
MLPLSEIHAMSKTLDEAWHSPVADALAAPWGIGPSRSHFLRSSATHVFVVRDTAFPHGARFLRAVPGWHRDLPAVERRAGLVAGLGRAGAGVAVPVPSQGGRVVESVATELGVYHVMLVEGAPGGRIEVSTLTAAQATVWGAALAGLHLRSGEIADPPSAVPDLRRATAVFAGDSELVAAILAVADRLDALATDASRFGLTHNDFELDNLAWKGGMVTAFDFDESGRSWFAADVAKAVDELEGRAGTPLFDSFVGGYRSIRPLHEEDLALLPLFDLARAASDLIMLRSVLDMEAAGGHPKWLHDLHASLSRRTTEIRSRLLGA